MALTARTTTTVSMTEFKNRLGELTSNIVPGKHLVVESRGKRRFVVMSEEEASALLEIQEEQRRRKFSKWYEGLLAQNAERHPQLSEDEIIQLAVEAVREVRTESFTPGTEDTN